MFENERKSLRRYFAELRNDEEFVGRQEARGEGGGLRGQSMAELTRMECEARYINDLRRLFVKRE